MISSLFYERLAVTAVNADLKFAVKSDVTNELSLLNCRQFIKFRKVHHVILVAVRIHVNVTGVE